MLVRISLLMMLSVVGYSQNDIDFSFETYNFEQLNLCDSLGYSYNYDYNLKFTVTKKDNEILIQDSTKILSWKFHVGQNMYTIMNFGEYNQSNYITWNNTYLVTAINDTISSYDLKINPVLNMVVMQRSLSKAEFNIYLNLENKCDILQFITQTQLGWVEDIIDKNKY